MALESTPHDWQSAISLFDAGRFFEAHEVLEDTWREAPPLGGRRRHLQGLVQLAVAFHHQSTGNWSGAGSVLERAVRSLTGAEESFPELDWQSLRASLTSWCNYLAGGRGKPEGSPPDLPQLKRRLQQ